MRTQAPSPIVVTGAAGLRVRPGEALAPRIAPGETTPTWVERPARLARLDRLSALALVAANDALLDAGIRATRSSGELFRPEQTGVVVGSHYGCHHVNEEFYRGLLSSGLTGASPRAFAATLPSSPSGELSIHLGLQGPSTTLVSGEGAGVEALGQALGDLAAGRAELMIALGVEVATPLLEQLLGRGALVDTAAAFVLETEERAAARGATPRARLLAAAQRHASTWPARSVAAAALAALEAADLPASALAQLLAPHAGLEGLRAAGASGLAVAPPPEALSVGPLLTLVEALCPPDDTGPALPLLVAALDAEGSAAVALVG
jgi:3-oxoacyl-[acyl-carrier-protein] synthase II